MLSNHDETIELLAEWAPQSGILLVWPHSNSDWKNNLTEIEQTYIEICEAITPSQRVLILCYDKIHQSHIKKILKHHSISDESYVLTICKTNDTWCRDYGPISTHCDGKLRLNSFVFNGWDNKYNAELDNTASKNLHQEGLFGSTELLNRNFILEGGSIDCDGHNTLLTTSQCLLKRHPDKNKNEIEGTLKKYLGITTVHWLDHGQLSGDDTDAHIDNLARFVNKETIVYSACDNEMHPDYDALKRMEAELKKIKQRNNTPYNLVPIYLPKTIEHNKQILPASYVNFVITNDTILVPCFNDSKDDAARTTFQHCFPEHRIMSINSIPLIKQFGGLHCATMNLAAGVLH